MRAAIYYGRQDLRLESAPEPMAGPGDVKLRVLYNGICGSDLHEYYDGPITTRTTPHPLTGVTNPVILGHELCGEVVELGQGVEDLSRGDLVAVDPLESCGHCTWCLLGQYRTARWWRCMAITAVEAGWPNTRWFAARWRIASDPALTRNAGRFDRTAGGGLAHS